MFHSTPGSSAGGHGKPAPQLLQLVGVVCYYGKHYSTFFYHSKVQEWIYFDDASVKQVCYFHNELIAPSLWLMIDLLPVVNNYRAIPV